MKPLVSEQTEQAAEAFLKNPGQALLIEAAVGSGKGTLASYMSSQLLNIPPDKLASYPFFQRIEGQVGASISIDTIRGVQQFLHLKTIGKNAVRRILIVENAQLLTTEAQNAFLKMLEEPPSDTVIILTATTSDDLLPTIQSRVQRLKVGLPLKPTIIDHFTQKGYGLTDIERSYHLSEGRLGLLEALLTQDASHPLRQQIEIAKKLLSADRFSRLQRIDELARQREELPLLLQALELVSHAAFRQASSRQTKKATRQWYLRLKRISKAQSQLQANPNAKLLLTDILINL